jgi:serine-type D-Ala-D-Ala carboxypeptidase/endopeptidase
MTWAEQAAPALTEALRKIFDTDGVVLAAAALERDGTTALALDPAATPDEARFEIGSVTKTMTATLLALLADRGALSLDDEIGRWLAAGPNAAITVRELATHTSGLPRIGPSLTPERQATPNPWAGYTFAQAEQDLRAITPAPDHPHRYSNLGYHLLGLILERAGGRDYPTLLTEELFDPLGMAHSGIGPRGAGSLLPGHNENGEAPQWDHPWGAGGVEATIADLARYARACLTPPDSPLGAAITRAQTPVLRIDPQNEQALAWFVHNDGLRVHTGGTGGFTAYIGVDHGRGHAIALLASLGGNPVNGTHFRQAAQAALDDQDPRQVVAPDPWPTWREDACDVAQALLDGRTAEVHARLIPMMREKITVQKIDQAWARAIQDGGATDRIEVVRHSVASNGAVLAVVEIGFAAGPRQLRVGILRTGELGGFSLVPPTSAADA